MKKSTKILIGTVLVVSSLGVVKVFAGGPFGHGFSHHDGDGEMFDKITGRIAYKASNELDLTEQQKSNLDALIMQSKVISQDMQTNRASHKEQLIQLLTADTLNQDEAMNMLMQKTENVQNFAPQMIAAIAQFTDSLDSTQKEKMKAFIQQRTH